MPGRASHEIRDSRLFEDCGDVQAWRRSAQEIVRDSLDAAERLQEKFRAFIKPTGELARK
jgi:hypothetical protein